MRLATGLATIVIALGAVSSAEAKGCLKGAAVGGVAGHYAGHHGVLGAMAGCVVGRHQANKRTRMQNGTDQRTPPNRGDRRSPNEESM
jgi:outer membrane lipoprotein SlyB